MARVKAMVAKEGRVKKVKISKTVSKSGEGEAKVRKPRRYKSGTVSMRSIRKYQKSTKCLLPKMPFARQVRSIEADMGGSELRIQKNALELLRNATEAHVVNRLKDANKCAVHSKRITLTSKDINLGKALQEE